MKILSMRFATGILAGYVVLADDELTQGGHVVLSARRIILYRYTARGRSTVFALNGLRRRRRSLPPMQRAWIHLLGLEICVEVVLTR